MISFGSSHTNGNDGKITYNGQTISYDKIFCLDNKMGLDEIYKILHNKDNFGKDVAFVLNSDLDFSEIKDYRELNNNLTLTDYKTGQKTFLPIGGKYDSSAGGKNEFNTDFYGNNHKIIVGNIDYPDNNNVGFFGFIGGSGKVYDLQLQIGNINGKQNVGSFVGWNNYGIIKNSSIVVNSVDGSYDVGGFVGLNHKYNYVGTIENSSVIVNSVKGKNHIGGFVGSNEGIIENTSAVVDTINGNNYVGGFVGKNYHSHSTIENSSVVVKSVSGNDVVGGFIGYNYNGTIKNASAIVADTINGNNYVGGFVGWNDNDYDGIIKNIIARVLVLDGASSKVSAGYYSYNDSGKYITGITNTTNFDKQEFFFGNNKGLSYDGTTLKITVPTKKIFNDSNFPSAFSTDNNNWGNTIMSNLSSYWNTNGWDKENS